MLKKLSFAMVLLAALATASAVGAGGRAKVYRVTITNLTKGQVFSPPVIVTHKEGISLFEVGQPASPELIDVAENGVGGPLADLLNTVPDVFEAKAMSDPIPPGASMSYEIESNKRFNRISVVGMLVNTNDGMFVLDTRLLPRFRGQASIFRSLGYDAGSEMNDEDCDFVPGPACPGSPNNHADENGFVHIHTGVHGIADLSPTVYDWRNPVAVIKVRRIR